MVMALYWNFTAKKLALHTFQGPQGIIGAEGDGGNQGQTVRVLGANLS